MQTVNITLHEKGEILLYMANNGIKLGFWGRKAVLDYLGMPQIKSQVSLRKGGRGRCYTTEEKAVGPRRQRLEWWQPQAKECQ